MDQMDLRRTGSPEQPTTAREGMVKSASAYADLQQHRSEGIHRKPSPVSSYVPPPDYLDENEDDDLIKPKKLVNPVKASKSHQELHRELMSSYKRGGGQCGDEAGAAPSAGVQETRSADQTEETGRRSSEEDFTSGGRTAEETQEAGGAGEAAGEGAGGKPESSRVRQSERESETDVFPQ
ncbi:protein FAM107B-like isoform X6 [Lates japonicus]